MCRLPLPPLSVSPNVASHRHWRQRADGTAEYRMLAKGCFNRDKPSGWSATRVVVSMDYYCTKTSRGYRPRDTMNAIAAMKAAIDGMADAGIVPNDSKRFVSWGGLRLFTTREESAAAPDWMRVDRDGCVILTVVDASPV